MTKGTVDPLRLVGQLVQGNDRGDRLSILRIILGLGILVLGKLALRNLVLVLALRTLVLTRILGLIIRRRQGLRHGLNSVVGRLRHRRGLVGILGMGGRQILLLLLLLRSHDGFVDVEYRRRPVVVVVVVVAQRMSWW